MRFLLVFAVVLFGCVATIPSDPTISADMACETARMVVQLRQEVAPTPAPPSGVCENCEGRGYVGDGNGIKVPCQPCGGTGKK